MADEALAFVSERGRANLFWRHLGIEVEAAGEGWVRLRVPMRDELRNAPGAPVHGGVLATLVDAAIGGALGTYGAAASGGVDQATLDLKPEKKSRMYIVMEYVEGTSLRKIMSGKKPVASERALNIARQVCEALIYMHEQGVVHRDLKPENILLTNEGRVKILDFGIALDASARRLTWTGLSNTMGTPNYVAPEQIGGRRGPPTPPTARHRAGTGG